MPVLPLLALYLFIGRADQPALRGHDCEADGALWRQGGAPERPQPHQGKQQCLIKTLS